MNSVSIILQYADVYMHVHAYVLCIYLHVHTLYICTFIYFSLLISASDFCTT